MGTGTIAAGDLQILEDARQANPEWFDAVLTAGEVMADRRKKWSGKAGPYANFIRWAQALHVPVERVFELAVTLKLTRDQDTEADDDSQLDNVLDQTNYSALALGWRLMPAGDKLAAMLELGVWIDHRLLRKWEIENGQAVPQEQAATSSEG